MIGLVAIYNYEHQYSTIYITVQFIYNIIVQYDYPYVLKYP